MIKNWLGQTYWCNGGRNLLNCRRTDTVKGKKWMRRSELNRRKCVDYVEKPWVGESDRDSGGAREIRN